MLTEKEIRTKIMDYCTKQDESHLSSSVLLSERIKGLCEALGADPTKELSAGLLESVGIRVKSVNPRWVFGGPGGRKT